MKTINILACLLGVFTMLNLCAGWPFALEKLAQLNDFKVKNPAFITSIDGCKLAYYAFVPESPQAVVVFYHGAGFYGSALYQHFASQLANKYNIACYLFDIRGHGNSQGDRGDGPSACAILDDVTVAVTFVHGLYSNIPLYLGGHSSGAGMVLNYTEHNKCSTHKSAHNEIDGYLLVTPYLGRNSGVFKEHADQATSFIKYVRSWVFILNGITGGYCFAHTPAVFFNYPKRLLASDPKIVTSYTPTMTAATSPENPQKLFAGLDKPFGLFIAADDEQFIAQKIAAYQNYVPTDILKQSTVQIIDNTKHLDILLSIANQCAKFIIK